MPCKLDVQVMIRRCPTLLLLATIPSVIALGCEKEALPTDPQASISGSVTYDGKPITLDSDIVFHCKDKGATAAGKIDSLGKFTLAPGMKSIGIPAGRYQIMIRPPELPAPAVGTEEYEKWMSGKTTKLDPPKDVPKQFHLFDTNDLVVEVKSGPNTFDFDLAKLEKK
jgi:hypothetical protein